MSSTLGVSCGYGACVWAASQPMYCKCLDNWFGLSCDHQCPVNVNLNVDDLTSSYSYAETECGSSEAECIVDDMSNSYCSCPTTMYYGSKNKVCNLPPEDQTACDDCVHGTCVDINYDETNPNAHCVCSFGYGGDNCDVNSCGLTDSEIASISSSDAHLFHHPHPPHHPRSPFHNHFNPLHESDIIFNDDDLAISHSVCSGYGSCVRQTFQYVCQCHSHYGDICSEVLSTQDKLYIIIGACIVGIILLFNVMICIYIKRSGNLGKQMEKETEELRESIQQQSSLPGFVRVDPIHASGSFEERDVDSGDYTRHQTATPSPPSFEVPGTLPSPVSGSISFLQSSIPTERTEAFLDDEIGVPVSSRRRTVIRDWTGNSIGRESSPASSVLRRSSASVGRSIEPDHDPIPLHSSRRESASVSSDHILPSGSISSPNLTAMSSTATNHASHMPRTRSYSERTPLSSQIVLAPPEYFCSLAQLPTSNTREALSRIRDRRKREREASGRVVRSTRTGEED
ncbi:hypothetical protein ADUPG1_013886 [Aduncisulcus paluster]|uniref:EGF-like domain-containing protein n=1 Tax=Aduncisulcus paluster TaxID=2918883 RepID=A0ABQ5K4M4_9EUKA|nr:hypothetical protein ADUPG1_013886 [Aduncisulcus paluster]